MADYGLIGGLAQGLSSGLSAYQDAVARREKREADKEAREFQRQQFNAELAMKGFQTDPETGKYVKTDEQRRKEKLEGIGGLLGKAGDDAPYMPAYGKYAEGLISGGDIDVTAGDFKYPQSYLDAKLAKRREEKMSPDDRTFVTTLSTKNANKESIANSIDAVLSNWDNLSEDEQLTQGRQLIKVLNSSEGQDAVGAEEAKRLGSKLQFAVGNFLNDNPIQWGRDLPGFKADAQNTVKALRSGAAANQKLINQRKGIIPKDPTQPEEKIIDGVRWKKVPGGWEEVLGG